MKKNIAFLVHYEYCSGCHSCELACRNELGLGLDEWGIKVLEDGPRELKDGSWHWDYIPHIGKLCDGCAARVEHGDEPSCVQHCQAKCMKYGTLEEMLREAKEIGERVALVMP